MQSATAPAPQPPAYLIVFFGALVAVGALSMDSYLPAIPALAEHFGVSIVSINNTLSAFLLGYGVGQFFGGSLSDQVGRKIIGYVGLSIYVGASLAIAFAHNVEQMLVLRFLQALGGGFSTVVCMATVRDVYPVEQLGRRFATVTMVVLVAPLVAPIVGAAVLPLGWQMIFVLKACYGAALLLLYTFLVRETRSGSLDRLSLRALLDQCVRVVTRRVEGRRLPIRYATAMALATSVMMIFVTNVSFIYMQYFGVPASRFPLYFAFSVFGFMSLNLFSMKRLNSSNAGLFFRCGLTLQICAVTGLLLVTLTGHASLGTTIPLIVVSVATLGLIGPSGSAQYMGFFKELAGSASSVYMTMVFFFGGTLGALTGVFYDGTLLPVAATMFAASCTASAIGWSLPLRAVAPSA